MSAIRYLRKFFRKTKSSDVAEITSPSSPTREKNGLFILADTTEGPAEIDIVAVHGLGGDAYGTWDDDGQLWLRDFLPHQIPRCRVLTYGYESIRKLSSSVTGINDIAADLLERLNGERTTEQEKSRPIIFICHSLGGIIFKQALIMANEQLSFYSHLLHKVNSVVFMGTPHRGAGIAFWGEFLTRASFVADLGLMGNTRLLSDLKKNSPTLAEISRQFTHRGRDLHIRSFYEREKYKNTLVVDPDSAQLNLPNEKRIPIQANHRAICKFPSADCQKYKPVIGAIKELVAAAEVDYHTAVSSADIKRWHKQRPISSAVSPSEAFETTHVDRFNDTVETSLPLLWFPSMGTRLQDLAKPVELTCHWLFHHPVYRDWFDGRSRHKFYGLLWLKGKPGAGKSVLMKEAFRRAKLKQSTSSDNFSAAFFFNAKGDELEKSPVGLFRSLLHQLLPIHPDHPQLVSAVWYDTILEYRDGGRKLPWREAELKSIFEAIISQLSPKNRGMFIFVDALDECDLLSIRPLAYFWREITKSAYGAGIDLKVCLSSRPFPSVTVSDCVEIVVEEHNGDDIATYVDQKFHLGFAAEEPRWEELRDRVLDKSGGVFLWVILVMDTIINDWEDGKGFQYLSKQLDVVPQALEDLFSQMFSSLNPEEKSLTVRLFQWVILSTKPLRLHEWHHILAFIRRPVPLSLQECRASDYVTEDDAHLEKQIRSISKGLVEVRPRGLDIHTTGFDNSSACAAAGSLDLEQGETRVVQVIHQSVREFFLWSNGFLVLDPNLESDVYGNGHLSIMSTCLDYIRITELDALIQARRARPGSSDARENLEPQAWRRPRPSRSVPVSEKDVHNERRLGPTREQMNQVEEEGSRMDMLGKFFSTAPHIDIPRWMETSQLAADMALSESSPCSTTHRSLSCRSQVLEAYPALLSYATFELFSHARLADKKGTDPSHIISRLEEQDLWDRWVTLREDIPQGLNLPDYAMSQRLSTWVDYNFDNREPIAPSLIATDEKSRGERRESNAELKTTAKDFPIEIKAAVTTTGLVTSDKKDKQCSHDDVLNQSKKRLLPKTPLQDTVEEEWVTYAEDYEYYDNHNKEYQHGSYGFRKIGSVASFSSAGSHSGSHTGSHTGSQTGK